MQKYEVLNSSEVCHPRCTFKLYDEVNSVKEHSYKLWLNDGYISKEKLYVSAYSGHLQVPTIFC